MARIRSIKPTFFRSRSVKRLNPNQKLVWIGLWNLSDDEGRMLDEPGQIVGDLWALSLSEARIDSIINELHKAGRLIRYAVAGESYIQITNWTEHQKISKPYASKIPPAPVAHHSGNVPGTVAEGFGGEGRGKGRGSKEGEEPPAKCPSHIGSNSAAPCGPCGDARREHDAWVRTQKNRPIVSGIVTDPDCERHPGRPARGCDRCAEEAVA